MDRSAFAARFTSNRLFNGLCTTALFLALSATSVWGQSSNAGTVSGQVTDEQNAAVPGCQVKVIDTSTNAAQTTITNADGRYVFSQVNPGTYNISFTKQGFSTYDVNTQNADIGTLEW